jgi:AcrR family transcriptional regulator
MPRRSVADAAITAEQIVAAATARFATDGFGGASLDDIARAAGVTRGAVYHHFGDKLGLLRAAAAAAHTRVATRVADAADAEAEPREQLRAGSHAFLDAITETDAARLLLVEAPAALGWAAWRELDEAASERELRTGVGALVAPDHVDAWTRALSGAMNEAALQLAAAPDDAARRASVHAVLDRLIDAVE